MEQRDYIKRQIEQIGAVLRHIMSRLFGLGDGGMSPAIIEQTHEDLCRELDIDISHLISIDPKCVISELRSKGFDYGLLIDFRSVIDTMARAVPDEDPRKTGLAALSSALTSGIQDAYSIAEFPIN